MGGKVKFWGTMAQKKTLAHFGVERTDYSTVLQRSNGTVFTGRDSNGEGTLRKRGLLAVPRKVGFNTWGTKQRMEGASGERDEVQHLWVPGRADDEYF